MERKINCLSICYTMFLALMILSGNLDGALSQIVYYSAFLLPVILGLALDKQGVGDDLALLSVSKKDIKLTLPLIVPTVIAVMLMSFITSIIVVAVTGAENNVNVGDRLIPALLGHALLPSFLEELLFRYLPMKLLARDSKRLTVIASALFFALAHHSFFSIPYAFVAGIIFMSLDLMAGSLIPSFILHFINNAISIGMIIYADNEAFTPAVLIILGVLLIVSILFILKNKKTYVREVKKIFKKDANVLYTVPLKIFAAISLFIAVITLM